MKKEMGVAEQGLTSHPYRHRPAVRPDGHRHDHVPDPAGLPDDREAGRQAARAEAGHQPVYAARVLGQHDSGLIEGTLEAGFLGGLVGDPVQEH